MPFPKFSHRKGSFMTTIRLPYGKEHIDFTVDEKKINGVLRSNADRFSAEDTQENIVKGSLEHPVDSPRLSVLARNARRVLVITSDHTRPVPSGITIPLLLQEIRRFNPAVEIKILIATGLHRKTTHDELLNKFGPEILEREDIVIHDSRDPKSLVFKGTLPSGGELWLNSLVDWADLITAEGFIEPHFFAGFSGGRKSILPGIAGEKTVLANHCAQFIANENSRTGILENNPIHRDMQAAARKAGLKFILNVVLDGDKRIIKSLSGDPVAAHREGCRFVAGLSKVSAVPSEIVVVTNGGYPLDQNVYQSVKGMSAAEMTVKPGGVIIMIAACEDGHGGESFYRWFSESSGPEEVAERIAAIPMNATISDQWEAQVLARILVRYKVIMVAAPGVAQIIRNMHMEYAPSLDEALAMAYKMTSADAKITVIPDGVSLVVEPAD